MKLRNTLELLLLAAFGVGCVSVPDPPPRTEDLSALAARYDHPTAAIPEARIQDFVAKALEILDIGRLLDQLRFIKTIVSDTSVGLEEHSAAEELDVQGVVRAAFPCPGDGPNPTTDAMTNGVVRGTFGVLHSRLQRGWSGALDRCLVRVVPASGDPQSVALSGVIVADLGDDLAIGNPLRLTRVFAITLLARGLSHQSPAHVRGKFTQSSTSIDADLGFRSRDDGFVACTVPGVAFSWSHVNLELGVGYGSWWLPIVELPLVGPGPIGEANFYVRF